MSNEASLGRSGIGVNLFAIFIGGAALYLSIQMTKFGILHIPIDMSELSNTEQTRSERKLFANQCADWTSDFGYRLICRKAIADKFFTYDFRNIGDPHAERNLDDVLKISALEPAYYVLLARLGIYSFDPPQEIVQLLRLSYLSGRGEQTVMTERFQIALAIWNTLDQTDKSIALNDFLKNYTPKREELYQLILSASPKTLDDIILMLKARDLENYNRIVYDMAAKK